MLPELQIMYTPLRTHGALLSNVPNLCLCLYHVYHDLIACGFSLSIWQIQWPPLDSCIPRRDESLQVQGP